MISAVARSALGLNLEQHTRDPWPPRRTHAVSPPRLLSTPRLADREPRGTGVLVDLAA
jgi:hypothetical protein